MSGERGRTQHRRVTSGGWDPDRAPRIVSPRTPLTAHRSPVVSVLLPCRDAEDTLDEALASLVAQTFTDLEIIAVDDGSTDRTAAVLAAWAARHPRIRVLRTPPAGIVAALNAAAAVAEGALLARMDADDVALPGRLAAQVAWLDAHPEVAVCGTQVRYVPREAVKDGARRYERWVNGVVEVDAIARDLFVECPLPHPTLVMRREAFVGVGGYRERGWPEDYDLVLRLTGAGQMLGKVPEVLLHWRERPDRLSHASPVYGADAFQRCRAHFLGPLRVRGRRVVVWGAGPVGKGMARALQAEGHEVAAFVELDARKVGQTIHGAPVVGPDAINTYRGCYTVAAVGQPGAREEIRVALLAAGWIEVEEFCAVA